MHIFDFEYPAGKTDYQIDNEDGDKTTIRLEKWVADILQIELPNVHKSIQFAYNKSIIEKPELSRKSRGNYIRQMSVVTANQFQETKKVVLGWNDQDILAKLR